MPVPLPTTPAGVAESRSMPAANTQPASGERPPFDGPVAGQGRHLSPEQVRELWSVGRRVVLPVSGRPACETVLDPSAAVVAARLPYDGRVPLTGRLRHVRAEPLVLDGEDLLEVTVSGLGADPGSGYGLLMRVIDLVQAGGLGAAEAVARAVAEYQRLLDLEEQASTERELGLYGELLVLEHLAHVWEPARAVSAWIGPSSEEHDFALPSHRLEVKTTAGERRAHLIHGTDQLTPSPGTDLYLVSIQVTDAGAEGRTLQGLVGDLERSCASALGALRQRLAQAGWSGAEARCTGRSWELRASVTTYLVDDTLPRISTELLASAGDAQRIDDLSYRLDLTGLPTKAPPWPADSLQHLAPTGGTHGPDHA